MPAALYPVTQSGLFEKQLNCKPSPAIAEVAFVTFKPGFKSKTTVCFLVYKNLGILALAQGFSWLECRPIN